MTDKKIAFCLCGSVGFQQGKYYSGDCLNQKYINPVIGYKHYKRNLFDHHNVDVFIHCWDNKFKEQISQPPIFSRRCVIDVVNFVFF